MLSQATYYWTGVTNTTWTVSTNWSPAGPPDVAGIVVIDTNAANQPILYSSTTVYSLYIATSGVYGSTMTMQAALIVSSGVTVGSKGVITHTANSSSQLYISSITANYMTINGLINAAAKGYAANNGPGAPTCGSQNPAGSYGGTGGNTGACGKSALLILQCARQYRFRRQYQSWRRCRDFEYRQHVNR